MRSFTRFRRCIGKIWIGTQRVETQQVLAFAAPVIDPWAAAAGAERRPWPHPCWPYGLAPANSGALPQNRRSSPFAAGSADTRTRKGVDRP